MTTTLVTGPVRSGKSRHAEHLLAAHGDVLYVACGRRPEDGDPEWRRRVERHQARRPAGWRTLESLEVAEALSTTDAPILVDCLGAWLTGLVDQLGWDDLSRAAEEVDRAREHLVGVVSHLSGTSRSVVLVTNEVGWSLVPVTAAGRFFADELGLLNAAVSAVADRVHLVVAGRVLDLTGAPVVAELPPPRGLHA